MQTFFILNCFKGQEHYEVGSIIGNTGVIVIGGQGNHIYQTDGGFISRSPIYTRQNK